MRSLMLISWPVSCGSSKIPAKGMREITRDEQESSSLWDNFESSPAAWTSHPGFPCQGSGPSPICWGVFWVRPSKTFRNQVTEDMLPTQGSEASKSMQVRGQLLLWAVAMGHGKGLRADGVSKHWFWREEWVCYAKQTALVCNPWRWGLSKIIGHQ